MSVIRGAETERKGRENENKRKKRGGKNNGTR
jgi:hypothetical protein